MGATPGPLLHGLAGTASPGVLGLGPMASHGASVSASTWAGEQGWVSSRTGVPHRHPDLCLALSRPQQMNQLPVGAQSSSGLQDLPQLYSPTSQPQFPLPAGTQQVLRLWGEGVDSEAHAPGVGWLGKLCEPQFTHLEHGGNILHHAHVMWWGCSFSSPKTMHWAEIRLSPWTVNLPSLQKQTGVGGVGYSG